MDDSSTFGPGRSKFNHAAGMTIASVTLAALLTAAGAAMAAPPAGVGLDNAPAPIEANALHLKTGVLDLAAPKAGLAAIAGPQSGNQRFVIHLDGPMTPDRRARLAAAGVKVGAYLPANAFIVRMDQADPAAAAALDFVRWHGAYENGWKLDPELNRRAFTEPERLALQAKGQGAVVITLFEDADALEAMGIVEQINALPASRVTHRTKIGGNTVLTAIMNYADLPVMAQGKSVEYIEESPEITFRNGTNRWIVQSNVTNATPVWDRGIHGEGQVIGILDSKVNSNHCAFSDTNPIGPTHRKILAYNTSLGSGSHGTHVAGTCVGDSGGGDVNLRGVAYGGKLVYGSTPSFNETAMVNALTLHHNQGARVHTNSWGNDGTTSYDSLCRGIDVYSRNFEDGLVLFAVTNTSTLKNPENAKNVVAVGASQDAPSQNNHCSGGTGPTSDQRRKPEIYAPGCSTISASSSTACGTNASTGTSMACPAVAGTAMLVRQYFEDGFYPGGAANPSDAFIPTGALVKAALLNSTVDMTGIAGYPSNSEGWGRVLADNALYFENDARALIVYDVRNADGMSTSETTEYTVNVLGSGEPLKVTMVFTDVPAASGAGLAPVNDLDLEVVSPSGSTYLGNVFSGGVSATGGTKDARNNVEQVLVAAPEVGSWTVRIVGAAVNQETQGFALVATGEVSTGPASLSIAAANLPGLTAPGAEVSFDVTVNPRDETLVPGSETLHFRLDGNSYISVPLAPLGGTAYLATLPLVNCGDVPEFYVSAESVESGQRTSPPGAPGNVFTFEIGEVEVAYTDDLEADLGWAVGAPGDTATTGVWVRVDPNGTTAQPENDTTADPGVNCWVTGQGPAGGAVGSQDVDGGATTLTSPVFDMSDSPNGILSYQRWFANTTTGTPGSDTFVIDISNDGGSSWTNLETVGPTGDVFGGWNRFEARVSDVISPTSQMRLRFVASDTGTAQIVEAAIDDLDVSFVACEPVKKSCPGDLDGDGAVGAADAALLLGAWGPAPGAPADLDGDGGVGAPDMALLLGAWGPCP